MTVAALSVRRPIRRRWARSVVIGARTGPVLEAAAPRGGAVQAETVYKPPAGLVPGGAFIDLIRPIPVHDRLESDVWGGDNVKPREVHNGMEDAQWSYWCASVIRGPDGKEHLFGGRWPENSPKGHNAWPSSRAYHAVSDLPTGPFVVKEELGPGHNTMIYQAKDGTYVVYVIGKCYVSKRLDGPWTSSHLQFDSRGMREVNKSNMSFTKREDGSILMVSRTGYVWVSQDGLKSFMMLTSESVYPKVNGSAYFEDPAVWRDEVQYHLIVNDWFNRTAYYLRSKDGIHWKWDQGKAYDPTVVRHPDGTIEGWHKLERPQVRQDEYGRATHLYLAAIDCPKEQDKGGDNHSSKTVALPLTVGRRLAILGDDRPVPGRREVRVEIKAEAGFDPQQDVDVRSLVFGVPDAVNFGNGCKALTSEVAGKSLVVTFDGTDGEWGKDDFAAKLLGRTTRGELLFGYARLPGQTGLAPILLPRVPNSIARLTAPSWHRCWWRTSARSSPQRRQSNWSSRGMARQRDLPPPSRPLPPYGNTTVRVALGAVPVEPGSESGVEVIVNPDRPNAEHFPKSRAKPR